MFQCHKAHKTQFREPHSFQRDLKLTLNNLEFNVDADFSNIQRGTDSDAGINQITSIKIASD